jgi:hypothetical protein
LAGFRGEKGGIEVKKGIPMERIRGLDAGHVEALRGLWITTAEELISVAMTADGVQRLASHLRISEQEASHLVENVKSQMPPEVLEKLTRVRKGKPGMGAVPPEED